MTGGCRSHGKCHQQGGARNQDHAAVRMSFLQQCRWRYGGLSVESVVELLTQEGRSGGCHGMQSISTVQADVSVRSPGPVWLQAEKGANTSCPL